MSRKLFPMLLFAALTLLLGLAIACGDDDDDDDDGGDASPTDGGGGEELTLEAYLTEVDEIQGGVTMAADSVGDQSQQAFSDPNMAFQAMSSAVDIGESAVASLQGLTPPAEAEEAHTNLIAAGEGLVAAVQGVADDVQGMEAGPEFDAYAEEAQAPDSDLSMAVNEMADACEAVQTLADDNSVAVDLECPARIE